MADFFYSRVASFRYAFSGLSYLLKTQKNAWIHAGITLVVFALGWLFSISLLSWAVIFLTIGMVWVAELFNTAIETIIDLVSPQKHPLAKIVKDVAAGAVLVSAATSVLVGLITFGPPILRLILPK